MVLNFIFYFILTLDVRSLQQDALFCHNMIQCSTFASFIDFKYFDLLTWFLKNIMRKLTLVNLTSFFKLTNSNTNLFWKIPSTNSELVNYLLSGYPVGPSSWNTTFNIICSLVLYRDEKGHNM